MSASQLAYLVCHVRQFSLLFHVLFSWKQGKAFTFFQEMFKNHISTVLVRRPLLFFLPTFTRVYCNPTVCIAPKIKYIFVAFWVAFELTEHNNKSNEKW